MSVAQGLAVTQVERIGMLCDFLEHPALERAAASASPVTMPPSVGSMGFDVTLWSGLGIVGLWAALDAFAEHSGYPKSPCKTCGRKGCLAGRLLATGMVWLHAQALEEMEDLRHLYAHNFYGSADANYLGKKRHTVTSTAPVTLSSGAIFDGARVHLNGAHLRHYANAAYSLLSQIR